MAFTLTRGIHVQRDALNVVRHLGHLQYPYIQAAGPHVPLNPLSLARAYVQDVAPHYGIDTALLENLDLRPENRLTDDSTELRFGHHGSIMETTTISYVQTHLGLPIWEAGISVVMHDGPLRVTSSQSTAHFDVTVRKPDESARFLDDRIDLSTLNQLLGLQEEKEKASRINGTRLRIYRHESRKRFRPESIGEPSVERIDLESHLPPVPETIEEGAHYVVTEVLFTYEAGGISDLHWRAFVEAETGAVLYVRAFFAGCNGWVYLTDPPSKNRPDLLPSSPADELDKVRDKVALQGLNPSNPQSLSGEFIELEDKDSPNVAPPTALLDADGNCDFFYSVPTDGFAAVNAYYHCDRVYRLMQDLGFNVKDYFVHTTFPISVDHRSSNAVSAGTMGAGMQGKLDATGVLRYVFNVVQKGEPVSAAVGYRSVLHEFCHHLLADRINNFSFGFAHSCGDSINVIVSDPGSISPDRFLTHQWVFPPPGFERRRHDRTIADGYVWAGGTQDDHDYGSEQILSTTMFRAYLSCGGATEHPDKDFKLAVRTFASRYLTYLMIRAIATLGPSPIVPTNSEEDFAQRLMDADSGTTSFEGHPGGAFHKVIRWSFEKQGSYRPAGTTPAEGPPPDVDVYIDDGRHGEYQATIGSVNYVDYFWETTDIWNRTKDDIGPTHEHPILDQTNYLYVRIKNRGSQTAHNVVVKAYHCAPGAGLSWPDDWVALDTDKSPPGGTLAPTSTGVVVGPFLWTPEVEGHECLLVSVTSDEDRSNIDTASNQPCAMGPIPEWRLVPFDNNIAQRNLAPVPGNNTPETEESDTSGAGEFEKSLQRRSFLVKNPYDRAVQIRLTAELPDFLVERGWRVAFLQPNLNTFTLPPRASSNVVFTLTGGRSFNASDVRDAQGQQVIRLLSFADNLLIGGMSYYVDPEMKAAVVKGAGGELDKSEKICLDRRFVYLLLLILMLCLLILLIIILLLLKQ